MRSGYHVATGLVLEIKVELHAISKAAHTVHVEESLEVLVGGDVHAMGVTVVPCC